MALWSCGLIKALIMDVWHLSMRFDLIIIHETVVHKMGYLVLVDWFAPLLPGNFLQDYSSFDQGLLHGY